MGTYQLKQIMIINSSLQPETLIQINKLKVSFKQVRVYMDMKRVDIIQVDLFLSSMLNNYRTVMTEFISRFSKCQEAKPERHQ